jgi:hypothetical protein
MKPVPKVAAKPQRTPEPEAWTGNWEAGPRFNAHSLMLHGADSRKSEPPLSARCYDALFPNAQM